MAQQVEEMSPWVDLRREIILRPDVNELRVKFAGEWERHGLERERAQLIRLQIHLANLPGGADHPEWFRLTSDSHRLILDRSAAWTPEWYGRAGISNAQFHRGFIECVTSTANALTTPDIRRKLLDSAPIRHLNIVGLAGDEELKVIIDGLLEDRQAWRIVSLNLDGQYLGDDAIRHLAGSELQNLQWLSVAYNQIGEAGVRALAEAYGGRLARLQYVNLEGNPANPVEEIYEDQGVVVGRRIPELQKGIPQAAWLRRSVVFGHLVQPDRFTISSSSPSDQCRPAPTA